MQQAPDPIPVFRPTYLSDLHEFQGSLVEAPANIFYQKVNASRATLDRMQFQWRSVSDNLLLSPVAMLRFKLKITCPQMWSQVLAYVNVHNTTGAKGNHGNDITAVGVTTLAHAATVGGVSVPSICFADGDAFTSCCSSINFVFNGTSLSLNRTNRYWRDFVRTQISSDDAAIIYKSAGGAYDKRDQRGVRIVVPTDGAAAAGMSGIAQDSGVSERCKNLYSLLAGATISVAVAGAGGAPGQARTLQVSYPIPVAPMNPFRGHKVANSCPYAKCPT